MHLALVRRVASVHCEVPGTVSPHARHRDVAFSVRESVSAVFSRHRPATYRERKPHSRSPLFSRGLARAQAQGIALRHHDAVLRECQKARHRRAGATSTTRSHAHDDGRNPHSPDSCTPGGCASHLRPATRASSNAHAAQNARAALSAGRSRGVWQESGPEAGRTLRSRKRRGPPFGGPRSR